jgi:hypothetical protein
MASSPGTSADGFRGIAAALALLAIVANLFAGLPPLPGTLGVTSPELSALCRAENPPGADIPALPGRHHDGSCCFTHQLAGAAVIPAPAALLRSVVFVESPLLVADQRAPVPQPHPESRPRAPPLAA